MLVFDIISKLSVTEPKAKEESDKSNSEESDTEVSLCRADKSKIILTSSVSNKSSKQQKKKCYKKKATLQENLGECLSLASF